MLKGPLRMAASKAAPKAPQSLCIEQVDEAE